MTSGSFLNFLSFSTSSFEMLGEPQRDLTAEQAAVRVRESSTTHYLAKSS